MGSRHWTPEEDGRLLAMRGIGFSHREIGEALGRATSSIGSRLNTLRSMPLRTSEPVARRRASRVMRPCMCCRRPFQSEGAHNRLCDPCRRKGSDISPFTPDPH